MTTIYIVDGSASMGQIKDELKEALRLHGVKEFFLAKPNGLSLLEVPQVDNIEFDSGTPLQAVEKWLKVIDLPYPENVMFITDNSPEYQIKGLTERDPDSPIGRIDWLNLNNPRETVEFWRAEAGLWQERCERVEARLQEMSNINPQGKNPLFDEILEVLVARGAVTREQASILAQDQHVIDDLWESKISPTLDRLQEQIFNLLSGKA